MYRPLIDRISWYPPGGGVLGEGGVRPALWTEFLTHACEYITFPQLLLRAVINLDCQDVEMFVSRHTDHS